MESASDQLLQNSFGFIHILTRTFLVEDLTYPGQRGYSPFGQGGLVCLGQGFRNGSSWLRSVGLRHRKTRHQ